MSTSPSWFDQEKFSRLVKKKAAPKTPLGPTLGNAAASALASARGVTPPTPPRRGSGTLPVIPSRASTGPLPAPPRSGPLPPPAGKRPTGPVPPSPLTRSGGVSPPMPSTRPATGPLPVPPRSSGTLPPPPKKQTGPLPVLARATGHLPPPPQRDASGRLPLPRSQTGRLPFPGGGSTETEPMMREAPAAPAPAEDSVPSLPEQEPELDSASAAPSFTPPAPAFQSEESSGPATPPAFVPPPAFIAAASAAAEKAAARPTLPMPDYQPLFGYDGPEDEPGAADVNPSPVSKPVFDPITSGESLDALEGTEAGFPSVAELQEQIELLKEERDQALSELEVARGSGPGGSDDKLGEDLATAIRERDEARMEVIVLRSRNDAAEQTRRDTDAMASQLEELSHVIDERDSVRRDYASLREQFETLKLDRSQLDSNEANQALQDEIKNLRDQLASREAESKGGGPASPGSSAELAALKEQVKQAKEETSLAHRGLALSQKALQETREALREATEGTSTSKGNLEEIKKERATLVRQNMLLQGQNEQLTRDLSAAKAKLAAKGP